ncbi:MAG TPA: hypothetical protein VIO32_05230 [Candidatus Baltobacteraceae bacterium]
MAHLEGTYEQVNERLASIEARFPALDLRLTALDRKIDDVYRALDAKVDNRFMWTVGIIVGTWVTTIGTISALLARH